MSSHRARTVSFMSASGGVGKTTLTLAFASYIYKADTPRGKVNNLLLVDLDPTAGLTLSVLSDEDYDKLVGNNKTLYNLLSDAEKKPVDVRQYVHPCRIGNVAFDILAPGEELGLMIDRLWGTGRPGDVFREALEKAGVYTSYDYVVFDSAPFFDPRYTVINLYSSSRYIVVLRPSLIDLKRTVRMLNYLARNHAKALCGDTAAFFQRFIGVFNMVRSGTDEGNFIDNFLRGKSMASKKKRHIESMSRYAEELSRVINIAPAYLPLHADYQRLKFTEWGRSKGEEEYRQLMEALFKWAEEPSG